ncbi:hypothetical protein HX13_19060 [Chryseobacterium sp. P1-3]|uniref:hypothetical protein n=1 Tax=Chryseobacterium TaxID=59732 RepID=UPI0004E653F8|nr:MULTISPECIES: hypothetical protein [Chryseobacterium]KFF73558.1 hypothetical protein HX13_19060 [Chryseobacterium sp. P1-3]MCL8535589.1 hypothetical protein [Chryseobacterium gallinarum]
MITILQINIDEGTATLAAAIIAAIFSLLTLLSTRPTEIRAANRKTLEAYIPDLSDTIHQLIAISNILLKNKTEESRGNWRQKAEDAKGKLKDIRPKIRYSLWGLEENILYLTRLPDFTLYTLDDIEVAKKVVKRGTRLGDSLDNCIRKCYLNGRTPRFYELWTLKFYRWHFSKTRNDYKAKRKTGR